MGGDRFVWRMGLLVSRVARVKLSRHRKKSIRNAMFEDDQESGAFPHDGENLLKSADVGDFPQMPADASECRGVLEYVGEYKPMTGEFVLP